MVFAKTRPNYPRALPLISHTSQRVQADRAADYAVGFQSGGRHERLLRASQGQHPLRLSLLRPERLLRLGAVDEHQRPIELAAPQDDTALPALVDRRNVVSLPCQPWPAAVQSRSAIIFVSA